MAHSGSNIGSETLQLSSAQDFVASIALGGAPVRAPAVGDTKIGQNARLQFTVPAGQKVSASLSNSTYASSPGCLASITDAGGALLGSQSSCTGNNMFVDGVTVPAAGTYSVFINPQQMGTGNVTVQLNDATDVTGTISIDGPAVTTTTSIPGQDVRLLFSATAGQKINVGVSGVTNPSASVVLLKPDGTQEALISIGNNPGQVFFMDTQSLAATGTYTLLVKHISTNVGSETLQLSSAPDITEPLPWTARR